MLTWFPELYYRKYHRKILNTQYYTAIFHDGEQYVTLIASTSQLCMENILTIMELKINL